MIKAYNKKHNGNKITIIAMSVLLALFCIVTPLKTFSANNEIVEISEELSTTIIEEIDNIDFSGLNSVIAEFNESNTNLFSIDNIKSKLYSIISGENAINYKSFISSLLSIIIEQIVRFLPLLSLIIAIGVISNLLNGVKSKFNEKSTSGLTLFPYTTLFRSQLFLHTLETFLNF